MDGDKALQAWLYELEARGRAPRTSEKRLYTYKIFARFLTESGLSGDTRSWCRDTVFDFYTWLAKNPRWSQTTRATWTHDMVTFWKYCRLRGWTSFDPPAAVPEPRGERGVLSKEQMRKLLDSSGKSRNGVRNKAVILLLMATGLRLGELAGLKLDDIDWQAGLVRIRPETSKSRRFRQLPLGGVCKQALYEYITFVRGLNSSPALFLGEDGQPLQARGIQMLCKRIARRSGIKQMHPRMLRHTFATRSLLDGVPLPHVQTLLGHTSINTTSIYLNQTAIQEAVKHLATPADSL